MNHNNIRPYLGELNDKQEATKLPRLNIHRTSPNFDQSKSNSRCRTGIASITEAQLCGRSSSIIIPNDSEIIFQDDAHSQWKRKRELSITKGEWELLTNTRKSEPYSHNWQLFPIPDTNSQYWMDKEIQQKYSQKWNNRQEWEFFLDPKTFALTP